MTISVLPVSKSSPRQPTPPTRGFTPTRLARLVPPWARALAGRSVRDLAAAARTLEADIHTKIELERRRGVFVSIEEIRLLVSEYANIKRHADDESELTFLFIFWHAFRTRQERERARRFRTLVLYADQLLQEIARALGELKRLELVRALIAIEDEARTPCARMAAALAATGLEEHAALFAAIVRRDETAIFDKITFAEVTFEPIGWNAGTTYTIALSLPGPAGFALRIVLDGELQVTLTHGSRLDIDLLSTRRSSLVEDQARALLAVNPFVSALEQAAKRTPDIGRLLRSIASMEAALVQEPDRLPHAVSAVKRLCAEIVTWPSLVHDLPWGPHPSFLALLRRAMRAAQLPVQKDSALAEMIETLRRG
jgi:hypothetical protein